MSVSSPEKGTIGINASTYLTAPSELSTIITEPTCLYKQLRSLRYSSFPISIQSSRLSILSMYPFGSIFSIVFYA